MASKPYPDLRRGVWRMKYRPDPTGEWVAVSLGKDPRLLLARPPKSPPQWVTDRAREFEEVEYRARHGMAAAPRRAKGLEDYLLAYADVHGATRRGGSNRQLRRHVGTFLEFCKARGVSTVQGVTRATCRDYLESRARAVRPSTLKTERGYLVGIWTRAVEDGLVAGNPWAGVKVPGKAAESAPVFWSAEEIMRIVAACSRPWHKDLVLVLANTGLRISTALAMEWSWVDWGQGTITIPVAEDVKTPYVHAMGEGARDVLERLHLAAGGSDLAFPNRTRGGGRIPYDSARDAIAKAIARSGVRPGTPHDLRHSYGRALAVGGAPVTVIQSQLGHTTLAMTMRYIRTDEQHAAPFVSGFRVGEAEAGAD